MSYWDTSALLKLYLAEPDSGDFEVLAAATPRMVIGFIGFTVLPPEPPSPAS